MIATTALEFLAVEDMKLELRLPSSETSLDGLIASQIASAVRWVSRETERPLVSVTETVDVPAFPPAGRPLDVSSTYVLTVDGVSYHLPGTALRDDPGGVIAGGDLGRLDRAMSGYQVYWPDGGWPQAEPGTPVTVTLTRGMANVDPGLRGVVVLACRDLYEGQRLTAGDDSLVSRMLAPYRPYGYQLAY